MPAIKKVKSSCQFVVDCSAPVQDQLFDMAAYEKYIRDRVKVNGRTNNLQEAGITISRADSQLSFQASDAQVAKRYLKYLTKKFLKKHQLRDWLRVISTDKMTYTLKYYRVGDQEEEQ